ncbi:10657_t:CDS:2, partial [Cetraspora pellucida]
KDIEEMLRRGSNWRLVRIEKLYIEAYTLRRAISGLYISTPKKLANTKCTINPDNSQTGDDMCLKYALGAYFASKRGKNKNLQRLSVLQSYLDIVNLDEIPMPTPICSHIFNKIEEMNPDISINIWEWKEEKATPKLVIASKNYNRQHIIDLMAFTDITKSKDDKYRQRNHFLWIKNLDGLVFKDTAHYGKRYICKKCTISWPSKKSLAYHQKHCSGLGEATQEVKLPTKDVNDFEKFKNYERMINAPCVIIADFEADNKKCDEKYGGQMRKLAEQKANSFCYLVYWIDTGKTDKDKKKFNEADSCWICKEKFIIDEDKTLTKQIDKITKDINQEKSMDIKIEAWKTPIPVIFYNFRGYDSHLVCESVGKSVNAHQIKVVAETFERYKSMKVGQLKYIDSMQFMNSSLASLTKNLGDNHPITSEHFKKLGYTKDQLDLVYRKGVYPYDYMDSQDRFLETELPPIHEFSTYLHGEYHDIYLKTDVLSLADVWTQLRKMSMEYDGLDPSHYVSLPAYSWDAMLKMTGVKIELFTDMAMHDFIEKAKRGGIAMACKRYFKANNPKMGKVFNPSKPTTWISYVDATNLYGWAMSQYLPIGNYKWEVSHKYLEDNSNEQKKYLEKILNTKADAKRGYFLNIKAHFPLKTHDYLSDLPPAVENMAVNKNMLCPHTTELVDNLDSGCFSATEKLVPHLGPREDYVIHYQELQYYIKLGMIVDEVTEILSFDQDNWLAPYIAFNTEKRNEAKKAGNTFLSDFFKLKNNAVYGKTMENVRKYQDVKLMAINNEQDEKKFINQIRKLSFKYARQLASVLGLSKLHIYYFWYGYVKEKYGDKAQLGYMDTDSFIFQVETEDIYKDMEERPDLFNLNGDTTIGKFKDETPDSVITEFYHIRAKSYHYVLANKSTKSKHKGVSKKGISEMAMNSYMPALEGSLLDDPVDRSLLTEQEANDLAMRTEADPMTLVYRDCLFGNEVFHAKNVGIRSKDHILSLVESKKKALCSIDTKRWILSDKITSFPYWHWRIQAYKNFISNRISSELAEQRALSVKLSKKYQNESVFHISMTL